MTIQTKTLMRKLEADLRAAFPDVEFTLSVPEWPRAQRPRRRGDRVIEIFWCDGPSDAAVSAVTGKYDGQGVSLFVNGTVSCERCGEPTYPINGFVLCVHCEPDLWGCGSEENRLRAIQRLKAEAADPFEALLAEEVDVVLELKRV